MDEEENIYVYMIKENVIHMFDNSGNEVYKKEFRRGQGPNEFFSIVPRYASDGRVFIYDRRQLRMAIMNNKYEIQNLQLRLLPQRY